MNKKNFILSTLILSIFVFFTSCDKDVESTALVVNLNKTITIKGYVYAELNKKSAGLEFAPEGTIVIASVPYSNFNGAAGVGKWYDTAVVDNDGMISIDIPVDDDGVLLTLEPQPFNYNQVQPFGSNSNTLKKYYTANPLIINVSTTSSKLIEIVYNENIPLNTVEKVKLFITIEAELDNSILGRERVKQQSITLHNNEWAQEYTTDQDGKIVATVPKNQFIYYTISFEYEKTVPDGSEFKKALYKYEDKSIFLGNFGADDELVIYLGEGVPVEN